MTINEFVTLGFFIASMVLLFVLVITYDKLRDVQVELEVEKRMHKLVEHQLEIAEKEIMRREGLDQMKDTYIKIQKQEKDLMKWQAEQGEGEIHGQ